MKPIIEKFVHDAEKSIGVLVAEEFFVDDILQII